MENGICGIDIDNSDTTCTITINRSTNTCEVVELMNLPRKSFILTNTDNTFYNYNSSAGCFYLDRTSGDQTLVFIFITRFFSIIVLHSIDDNSISGVKGIPRLGICNVTCNFNLCKSNGSSISYDELVPVIQDRQLLCYRNASSIHIERNETIVSFDDMHDDDDMHMFNIDHNIKGINTYCMGKLITIN